MNTVIKSVLLPLMLLLSGCGAKDEIHTVDPSDHTRTPPLSAPTPLRGIPGFELSPEHGDYLIPPKPPQAKGDSQLPGMTLLPPIQPLALLPGSRAYYREEQAYLQLGGRAEDDNTLWQKLNRWLLEQQIKITAHHAERKTLSTDWIDWPDAEVKPPHRACYQLAIQRVDNQPTLVIRLTAWQPALSTAGADNRSPDPNARRRYTLLLLNRIAIAWEKERATRAQPLPPAPPTRGDHPNG